MESLDKLKQIIGERIKSERTICEMSQQELSKKIGKSVSTISGYEIGDRLPPIEILHQLADIFECSTDYLVGRSPNRDYRIEAIELKGEKYYIGILNSAKHLTKEEKIKLATQLLNDANK